MTSERPSLFDVNVLVALAWPNHLHHRIARSWFAENRGSGWATCPLTESSFVRISSHPKIGPEPRSVRESMEWLSALRSLPGHRFVADDVSFAASLEIPDASLLGHRSITDAHLLALARRNGLALVTFDRGIEALVPSAEERATALHVLG